MASPLPKHYLLASDFDRTLSFNDSGFVLSELLGISSFQRKVDGLRVGDAPAVPTPAVA
jgi:hypothetical protein